VSRAGTREEFEDKVCVAITGASGAQYALRLIECLVAANWQVALLVSSAAEVVMRTETNFDLPSGLEAQTSAFRLRVKAKPDQLKLYSKEDWFAPVASGSSAPRNMVICPASGGTLSAIAHGASNNLIERAADVAIKEGRKLIVVPRETPLSAIHLENMLSLARLGVTVLPASPGFYNSPTSIDDLVDFVVARILDQLGIEQKLTAKWGEA